MKTELTSESNKKLLSGSVIKELVSYKDLLYMLVTRDINVIYKQSILGFGWAIIRPLFQMAIFTIVFGKLGGLDKQIGNAMPYSLFTFIALVPWTYYSGALMASSSSLISDKTFLTKVYFPRIIIPLTPIIAKLIDFFIAFLVLIIMLLYYDIMPGSNLVFLPVLLLLMIISAFGLSLWFSALAIQYRDINQMIQFISQILMYAAPIMWPISFIPEKYRLIYGIYPMAGIIEGFRACLSKSGVMPWDLLMMGTVVSLIILYSGLLFFRSKEKIFADVA